MTGKKNPVAVAFGKSLKAVRTDVGVSQEDLALRCGMDRTYVSLLERGLRQPTLSTVFSLAKELKIDALQLVQQTLKSLKG